MMYHEERAMQLFREGYNCSQAVLIAFSDLTGLPDEAAAKLACSFGGGMGRLREVCGAVSGAFMVVGILRGYSDPKDKNAKAEHYKLVQAMAARFKELNGSIVCRELLGLGKNHGADSPIPEDRTEEYYKRRPCEAYIGIAARIADEFLAESTESTESTEGTESTRLS